MNYLVAAILAAAAWYVAGVLCKIIYIIFMEGFNLL
jgi:hypothetical protein